MASCSALVFLVLLFISSAQAQNAGLITIPSTVTPELGAYYINKLGSGFTYYRLLTQRNNAGTNAYALVNNISADADPISAARTISPLRGFYSKGGIGGKVTVEIFYKLMRCSDDNCAIMDRILVTGVAPNRPGPADALAVVRAGIGSSFWLLNANQATANALLAAAEERSYKDSTYNTQLYYKVNVQPRACSPVVPVTAWASIGEFTKLPQFGCLSNQGNNFLFATNRPSGVQIMTESIVPPERCDGSLAVIFGTVGPVIAKQVLEPGAVGRTVKITLAGISGTCRSLYDTPERLFALTSLVAQTTFYEATLAEDAAAVEAAGAVLGFNGTCGIEAFEYLYGPLVIGQSNALRDSTNNQTFLNLLLPYNDNQPCFALTGNSFSTNNRDPGEDACAAIFYGDAAQSREAVIAADFLPASTPAALTNFLLANQTADCYRNYVLSVQNIFPQVSIDFESTKNYLISSTEVKLHLDSVAANAASVLAVEVALASAGIIIARGIGRLGVYRRRQISTPFARAIALMITALGITLFNIPNFALISRSLANHRAPVSYTSVGLQNYAPGNFSSVVYAESYAFVTVRGSAATAVIGLIFYFITLFGSLYLTWAEFTEMIHRRREATERLGPEALAQGSRLLIEWRDTDALLHDRLYPKAVMETGQAAELELMRRQLEAQNASKKYSPAEFDAPPPPAGNGAMLPPKGYQASAAEEV